MTLTHQNLHAAASAGSGFNYDQLDILGVVCPPRRGWLQSLIGTHISDERYAELLSLKGAKSRVKGKSATLTPKEDKNPTTPVCVAVQALIRLRDSMSNR